MICREMPSCCPNLKAETCSYWLQNDTKSAYKGVNFRTNGVDI